MRAFAAESLGSIDNFRVQELPVPEPGPNQVRVRVHASAVNPADVKVAEGRFAGRFIHSFKTPTVLGFDLAGVVDAVGSNTTDFEVGDRVWGHLPYKHSTTNGCFAEYTVVDAASVAGIPQEIDDATAAAAATVGLTALQALRDLARHSSGHTLIVGAAGGVGSLAVGVAKKMGADVSAVCRKEHYDFVRSLGAEYVIDRSDQNWLRARRSYDIIFDTPSAYSYGEVNRALKRDGAYITTLPDLGLFLGKLSTIFNNQRCEAVIVESRREDLEELGSWIVAGLKVPINEQFPVKDAAHALEAQKASGGTGRLVIQVRGGWT